MATPKKEGFTKEDIKMAKFAKALSHPARIAILRSLASAGKCCFNDISRELPLADSTVSQHMAELRNAGLIHGNYNPPKVIYNIDNNNWKTARKCFKEMARIKVVKTVRIDKMI